MSITLQEYRSIIRGTATLAEIEAAQASKQVAQIVQSAPMRPRWKGDLPFPPSLNRYYRHVGAKVLICKDGRLYRKKLETMLQGVKPITGRIELRVDVYPPDMRRRDLDNLLKGLQDAMVHGGLMGDDSQIKRLIMEMHEPDRPAGRVNVTLTRISG